MFHFLACESDPSALCGKFHLVKRASTNEVLNALLLIRNVSQKVTHAYRCDKTKDSVFPILLVLLDSVFPISLVLLILLWHLSKLQQEALKNKKD